MNFLDKEEVIWYTIFMPYKTGPWGLQAKLRSIKRKKYFRDRRRKLYQYHGKSIGFMGEAEALTLLKVKEKLPNGYKVDIKWKGKLVDVKTAIYSKKKRGWDFLLTRQKGIADLFLIICKDENKKTQFIFLIPDKEIKTKGFYVSKRNLHKFHKFEMKVG
mgnify:CR=1 FL=1